MKALKLRPGEITGREECATIGWKVSSLLSTLPAGMRRPDMLIDVSRAAASSILAFVVAVIGATAVERTVVLGFPVVKPHRVSNGPVVEIEAILLDETAA